MIIDCHGHYTTAPDALGDYREQQQRDDIGDFDHRVDGRTRRILVRIANRIAGNRSLMGFGSLTAVVAVFDVLLGVIPGTATGSH